MEIVSRRRPVAALPLLVLTLPVLLAAGSPAAAAPAVGPPAVEATASVTLPPKVVAGPDGATRITLGFGKDRPGHPTGPRTITVDFGDLTGVADTGFLSPPCVRRSASAHTAVCTVPHDTADGSDTVHFNLFAQDDVQGGPVHVIRYTGSWGGVTARPATTEVKVGSAPDVRTGGAAPAGVQPGDTFAVPLTVRNQGLKPADGFRLDLYASAGLELVKDPACTYSTTGDGWDHARCAYAERLTPGATATAVPPPRMRALSVASDERIDIETASLVSRGPGRPLVSDHFSASSSVPVRVTTTADFRITGARLSGPVGSDLTARITLTNNGPATVSGWIFAMVNVEVPKGTHPVSAGHYCDGIDARGNRYPEDEDAVRYECWIQQDTSAPGTSNSFDFTFHVDKPVVAPGKAGYRLNVDRPPADPVPSNDTAAITVTVTGSAASATSSATSPAAVPVTSPAAPAGTTATASTATIPTATATPATGGLAATGAPAIRLIAVAGAAATAVGGLTFMAARRRRAARH
jgi:hypothetical protein